MSIVKWPSKVNISADSISNQELLMGILKLNTEKTGEKWQGKIITPKNGNSGHIEMRKTIGGTAVLIKIGDNLQKQLRWMGQKHNNNDRNIQISMNSKLQLTEPEMQEMNLAIMEGRNVYANLKTEWNT